MLTLEDFAYRSILAPYQETVPGHVILFFISKGGLWKDNQCQIQPMR